MGPSSQRWISWPFIREKWIQFPKQWRISVFSVSSCPVSVHRCERLFSQIIVDYRSLILNWMVTASCREWELAGIATSVKRVHLPFQIVPNSNPFRSVPNPLVIANRLNWRVSPHFKRLSLVLRISGIPRRLHWLVCLIEWSELTDLPSLKSIKCGNSSFFDCQSAVFESAGKDGLMIQICRNYNPSNSNTVPSTVTVMQEMMIIQSTRISWPWKVWIGRMMNR